MARGVLTDEVRKVSVEQLGYEINRDELRPTYNAYILHLLHTSWPGEELELVKAHYTARGVKAFIKDLNDNQIYALEIYPDERDKV